MNAGEVLTMASAVMVIFMRLLDRFAQKIEFPVFSKLVEGHPQLGVRGWFTDTTGHGVGKGRTKVVLRYARLTASARVSLATLLGNIVGLAIIAVVMVGSTSSVSVDPVRLIFLAAMFVVSVVALAMLVGRLVSGTLQSAPVVFRQRTIAFRIRNILSHLKLHFLLPYDVVAVAVGLGAVLAGLGV